MLTRRLNTAEYCGTRLPGIEGWLNHLLFADDIILFGKSQAELSKLIRITLEWAREYRLEINEDKTEVIALHTA